MNSTALSVINDPIISLDQKILLLCNMEEQTISYIASLRMGNAHEKHLENFEEYLNFLGEQIEKLKQERISNSQKRRADG